MKIFVLGSVVQKNTGFSQNVCFVVNNTGEKTTPSVYLIHATNISTRLVSLKSFENSVFVTLE